MCYAKSKKKLTLKFSPLFLTAVRAAYSATTCAMIIIKLSVCRIVMNSQPINRTSFATVDGKKVVYYSISTPFPTANTTANETDPTHHRKAYAIYFSAVLFQFLLCQQNVSVL
jgi:hypothetical protein